MKKTTILELVFVLISSAFALSGCASEGQDIVDESGNKIGEIKVTEEQDGSTRTTAKIDLFENAEEGEPCSSNADCGMGAKCINKVCVKVECTFLSDCDASADLCYQGRCMTESELFERFGRWEINRMCEGACENCKSGKFISTMVSGRDDREYRICTDCWDDNDCVEGAYCDYGKCVKK